MKIIKDRSFYSLVLKLSVPVILQNLITVAVSILDTMMLGTLGEAQISASSLANEYVNLFHILCMGIGGGASVMVSQYWGRKDLHGVRQTISLMIRISVGAGLLAALAAALLPAQIMSVFSNDAEVVRYGTIYLAYMVPVLILTSITQTLALTLRSVHQAKVPLYAALLAFVSNLFFNWVFIFGKLGMPRMEIAGAALGTLLSRVLETGFLWYFFLRRDKTVGMRLRDFLAPCMEQLRPFLRFGLPVIISDMMLGLGNTATSVIMGHISTEFVAGNAIVAPLVRLSTVVATGFGNASSVLVGNTLGRGDRETAYRQGVTFFLMSSAVGIAACLLLLILAPLTLSVYSISEETRQIAQQLIYAVSIMAFFMCTQNILTKGVLRGGGDTRFLMVADVIFLWIVSVPLGCATGLWWHCSPFIIYISLKIDWLIKTVVCYFRMISKKWIHVISTAHGEQMTEQTEGGV